MSLPSCEASGKWRPDPLSFPARVRRPLLGLRREVVDPLLARPLLVIVDPLLLLLGLREHRRDRKEDAGLPRDLGAPRTRSPEVSLPELRLGEVGVSEVRPGEPRAREVGADRAGEAKVRVLEVRSDESR